MGIKQAGALFICLSFLLLSCAGPSVKSAQTVDHSISGNTYINSTYNCKLSTPNNKWKPTLDVKDLGDATQLLWLWEESVYNAGGSLNVSKHPQGSLEEFAKKGTYDPKIAKYTYIAGKPAFFASKPMSAGGLSMTSQVYKFVNKGTGYVFSFVYPSQWNHDEKLQKEIDDILNSFAFLDEQGVVQDTSAGQKRKGENLLNVAMLEMVDLRENRPTKATNILTNELQEKLSKSGQFKFIERRKLNQIIVEQKLQMAGMVSDASAIKIGGLLGANHIITSSLGVLGETSVLYVQVTDTGNGKILTSASTRCWKCSDDLLLDSVTALASKLVSGK
ncbi:MAG: CsgG/HfaB family protein [Proteobacteria bacterium]|nr:CsgG/HfaB family protein [Pseudomonadota bacterium]